MAPGSIPKLRDSARAQSFYTASANSALMAQLGRAAGSRSKDDVCGQAEYGRRAPISVVRDSSRSPQSEFHDDANESRNSAIVRPELTSELPMSLAELSSLLSSAAVIGTLVLLLLQMRQTSRNQKALRRGRQLFGVNDRERVLYCT